MTCTEYDTVVAKYANSLENRLSQNEIERIAQLCPDCSAPFEMNGGHHEIECMWAILGAWCEPLD